MKYSLFSVALVLLMQPLTALAATQTANIGVTATILADCRASAPATAFGVNTAPAARAASMVSVSCNDSMPYYVSLSSELTPGATRQVTGVASLLLGSARLSNSAPYIIKSGRTTGTDVTARSLNSSTPIYSGYDHTVRAQNVVPEAFADAVTITVTY